MKITVSKFKEVKEGAPTHYLSISDDDFQNKKIVGKFWTKESPTGKFLSGELNKPYGEYDGYVIIPQKEYDDLKRSKEDAIAATIPSTHVPDGDQDGDII